jgi:flagellar operon protein (TIGR03826 family)
VAGAGAGISAEKEAEAVAELRNCKKCNRIFSYLAGAPICPECQKEEEKIFDEVSMYVRDHSGVPMTVVAKELDVPYDKIMKYVRDGRLQIKESGGAVLNRCERCGKEIPSGRYCQSCEQGLARALESSRQDLLKKVSHGEPAPGRSGDGGGYRFLKDLRKK